MLLRATANGGRSDSIGISEVNLCRRHGSAVLPLHQRHPILTPDLSKGISLAEPGTQPVGVARHRLRADRVQRHQHVIVSAAKTTDPVLGRTGSGIPDRLCSARSSFDERSEGSERERRNAFLHLQRHQSGPCDADVETIVGRATRGIGGIVSRSGRKPHVPVLGSRELRGVGFVAAHEPSKLPARLCRTSYRQQEMPDHRHSVSAKNEPLNVREVERGLSEGPRIALTPCVSKQPAEKPRAFHRRRCLRDVLLSHRPTPD